MSDRVDVCIVGGGIVGLFTAIECARQGMSVRLIDKIYLGATRYNIGDVMLQGHKEDELPFVKYSYDAWREAERELGEELGFETRGSVFLNYNKDDVVRSQGQVLIARAQELEGQYLEGRGEVSEWLGVEVGEDVLGAQISNDDGLIDTGLALDVLRRKLIQLGGKVWGSDEVAEILTANGRVIGVRTGGDEVCHAEHTIMVAGVWTSKLLNGIDVSLPLRPARCHLLQLVPPRQMPQSMLVRRYREGDVVVKYQPRSGLALAAYTGVMDQEQASWSSQVDPQAVAWLVNQLGTIMPSLGGAEVRNMHTITQAITPDGHACIGPWPELPGLLMAVGYAGRSYAFAPGVAKVLSAQIRGEAVPVEMTSYDPARFA